MTRTYSLARDGKALLTREQGAKLRAEVLEQLAVAPGPVLLDLTEVSTITPSFADELFGGLSRALGEHFDSRIQIRCPTPQWRRLIRSALVHLRRQSHS